MTGQRRSGDWTAVYVSCAGNRRIAIFAMDRATGALEAAGGVEVPGAEAAGPISMPLAVSPDRRFLYAAMRTPPFSAASFAIDPGTGALALLGSAALPDSMAYIITDPAGRHLLSASYQGGLIASHPIGADGAVRSPAAQVIGVEPKAHCIMPSRSGPNVYVPCLGGDVIRRFHLDAASGRLTPHGATHTETKAGPRHLVFDPSGRFAYVVNELAGSVTAYGVEAESGELRALQTVSLLPPGFVGDPAAADIHLRPDGRFLYASERVTNTLVGFQVDPSTGRLSPLGTFPAEETPRGCAIDPRGRFLLCAGQVTEHVGVYAIDGASGRLTRIARTPAGPNANWIEIVDLTASA